MKTTVCIIVMLMLLTSCRSDQDADLADYQLSITNKDVDSEITTTNLNNISNRSSTLDIDQALTPADITNMITEYNILGNILFGTEDNKVSINGITYDNIISFQPASNNVNGIIHCALNGKYSAFTSKLYLNNKNATIYFSVYCDGKLAFSSGKFTGTMEPCDIVVDVRNTDVMEWNVNPYGYCSNDMVFLLSPALE